MTGIPVHGRGGGEAVNASARHGSAARRLLARGSDTDAETPMSERESMKLRELKEAAHALFQRGRFAQCAETYAQLAKRLPRDANVRIRLASACRRAGQQEQAIAAYREAARVLVSLGCESRARGALKVALELDPRNPVLQQELARMGQGAVTPTAEDEELYRFDRLPPPTPPPARMRSVPPSITPVSVREAPLPKVIVSMADFATPTPNGNTPPSITPVVLNKPALKVQPALPRSPASDPMPERPTVKVLALRNREPESQPTPPASERASSLTAPPLPVMPFRPEMRRLAPNVMALRVSPQARWVIIRSESELEVSRSESLPDEFATSH
ncbi:BTAD domain-containing putative transcriptional regulator [Corallococcus interemptor]|uniref:BTAD domain-containing putative transcriptional regulator n=1 Tax=Corallococcus interemptor TaxID=2316720 RepID=UPI003D06EA2A